MKFFKLILLMLMISTSAWSQECTIGEVKMFAGNFAPRNWAFAHGQLMAISQNNALFAILGTTYGGDGRTTFALPDLRGRVPVGAGNGPGLSMKRLGEKGGQENIQLSQRHMPDIPISLQVPSAVETDDALQLATGLAEVKALKVVTTEVETMVQGENRPIHNAQPYQSLNYIVCLYGLFPSRN